MFQGKSLVKKYAKPDTTIQMHFLELVTRMKEGYYD